jgi:serine/threonine protein kinase
MNNLMNESFNNNDMSRLVAPQNPRGYVDQKVQQDNKPQGEASAKKGSRSIGHYIIGKNIGEGTFGKVKLGTHILTGEKVSKVVSSICNRLPLKYWKNERSLKKLTYSECPERLKF